MNCGFMIKFIYEKYLNLLWILLCMIGYLSKSLRIISLVWPTSLIFLAMGEVLSFGFNLAMSFPSDSRGSKARIVLLPSRIKRWGLYHIAWVIPLHHAILPNALLCSYELNTLDACWIAVDVWSNRSRCRIVSVYLTRTWCLCLRSCLDILITTRFSTNCSTVICSPTVKYAILEKPLVKPMAPGSILHHISFPSTSYFCRYLFCNLYFLIYTKK